jgi:hypothetical protein
MVSRRSLRYAADVRKIWYCRAWEKPYFYIIPHVIVALTLYFTLGVVGMLWCLYVPMLVVYNFTWAVNSICHMESAGYRTFETTDHSRNNFWVGLGAFGEGYHNNHHAQPRCAAHGRRWWEFDTTRYVIWGLEKVGLAWSVHWPNRRSRKPSLPCRRMKPVPCCSSARGSKIRPSIKLSRSQRSKSRLFSSGQARLACGVSGDSARPHCFSSRGSAPASVR